jgi:hypothetical protein
MMSAPHAKQIITVCLSPARRFSQTVRNVPVMLPTVERLATHPRKSSLKPLSSR